MRATLSIVVAVIVSGCAAPNPLGTFAGRSNGSIDAGASATSASANGGDDGAGGGDPQGDRPHPPHPPPSTPTGADDASAPIAASDAGGTSDAGAPFAGDASPSGDAVVQHCVDGVNAFRAQVGAPALGRSAALDAFAMQAAASDAQSGQVHGHFQQTNGGNGVASAESELPGYSLQQFGSVDGAIDQGLSQIENEGPGGAHYQQLVSTQYATVSCGYATTTDGQSVWITIDYH